MSGLPAKNLVVVAPVGLGSTIVAGPVRERMTCDIGRSLEFDILLIQIIKHLETFEPGQEGFVFRSDFEFDFDLLNHIHTRKVGDQVLPPV